MAKLVLRSGPNMGAEYPIKDARFNMGRRSQSDVPVADAKASREHAVIVEVDGALYVQDLSRNGTSLNDQPASKEEPGSPLKFGDKIKIGDTVYELVDEKAEPIAIDIPGYTILEKVGSGGMGAVFKARQLSMDRVVALKVLNERYSNNAEFVDRFIREARAAGKLNHPNVIHVHDISRANGRHYFSMEFIDGPSVRELLKKEKRIEVNKALDIVMQAAKALEFAHENRIVHRDIKPDNLMLTREGIVKIADLGIAKTFEEGGGPGEKGQRGILGTPHYMAPEQALGKAIDHRADVYSLGATFYHMLTGQTPFSGRDGTGDFEGACPIVAAADPGFQRRNSGSRLFHHRAHDGQTAGKALPEHVQTHRGHRARSERAGERHRTHCGKRLVDPPRDLGRAGAQRTHRRPWPREPAGHARPAARAEAGEDATGMQVPVHKIVSAVIWVALLIGAIVLVVQLPKLLPSKVPENDPVNAKDKNAKASNADARRLLEQSERAFADSDMKRYEMLLLKIKNDFRDSLEAEKADKLLLELMQSNREASKKNAERAFEEAKKFEADNPQNASGILAKYKEVKEISGGTSVYNAASAKVEQLEKAAATAVATAPAAPGSAKETFEKAAAMAAAFDYDGAKKLLKDLQYSTQSLEDGAEARKQIAKLDDEAKAKVKEFKDKTAALDPLSAAAEWSKYTSVVKDTANAAEVKPIIEALEDKTQTAAMEELGKASQLAKENKYAEAVEAVVFMQRKWAGLKWAAIAKGKEASFKRQKDLYEKFLKLLGEKVAAGPLVLPFPVQTKIKNQDKWQVVGVRDDSIVLDPIPAKAAPGTTAKLNELAPKEQYQLIMMTMPKEPTKEQHLALKDFCTERGLADEADKHESKAGN